MDNITRRDVLLGLGLAGSAPVAFKTAPSQQKTEFSGAEIRASASSVVRNREGVLIGIEGLICFGIVTRNTRVLGVDALIVDATRNSALRLHPHISVVAIPRDLLPMVVEGAVSVDLDYAYFPLNGRHVLIEQVSSVGDGPLVDLSEPNAEGPASPDDWKSMKWLASLDHVYSRKSRLDDVRHSRTLTSVVRFVHRAEFEPKDLTYGPDDKANGLWKLMKDGNGQPVEVKSRRAYKHSVHVFYHDPKGIRVSGLLPRNQTLEIAISQRSLSRPIRILSLPARAATKEELAEMKDARAYAELLKDPIPISERAYPVHDGQTRFDRTDSCGCCPMFRFNEEADKLPPI